MKKFFAILIVLVIFTLLLGNKAYSINSYDVDKSIYTEDRGNVVSDNISDNPIRKGTKNIGKETEGIENPNIDDSDTAKEKTLSFIQKIVNYFLGILGLVALLYLLYNFFLMVTAAGNEDKYKKGLASIKYAIIGIMGIGLSWLFISLIFYMFSNNII